jgi:cupin fold WbuC family metalloprotein
MRTITDSMLTELIEQAGLSERKRVIYRLHEHEEPVQRMVNALVPGTYVTPHQHNNPPKVELLCALRGQVAVVHFAENGAILDVHRLEPAGPIRVVDIAPGQFHSMVPLEPAAVLEIVEGPYDPVTHKQFAPWAPMEGTPGTDSFLRALRRKIDAEMHK